VISVELAQPSIARILSAPKTCHFPWLPFDSFLTPNLSAIL
jgi:hypothetical protein